MFNLDYKEIWVPKEWCFWTVVLEKTLERPLDCKEIQSVNLKEISPGCSLEELTLKLKLQYFGHLMWSTDSFEKSLMLKNIEGISTLMAESEKALSKDASPWKESYDKTIQCIKNQRHNFASKSLYSQKFYCLSRNQYGYESWSIKKIECWRIVVLEEALESPLDCTENKPVNHKENQSWILTWRTDAEAEALILWSSDLNIQLIEKDPDAWKDGRKKKKGVVKDKIVR